jgi:SAM-dependent methyltransferase
MDPMERMREDWDRRARADANYYAGFGRPGQDDREFVESGAEVVESMLRELVRLPPAPASERRALEIGCGPGRLMLPMSAHFGSIDGIDVSPRMAALARERLRDLPHARVHVTAGDGLAIFGDNAFDFIYSYAVFQHIPEPAVVLNYLRESRRVLKPGGVLCCQLRGAPPLVSEMGRESDTWTGCWFSEERMAAFARERDFPLLTLSGVETQYMWTAWVKPDAAAPGAAPRRCELKAVTPAEGAGRRWWPGPDAAVSLWLDGLARGCHLGNLEVAFGERRVRACYLTALSESGACQLNAWMPDDVPPGPTAVALYCEGGRLSEPVTIDVPPLGPRRPKVLSVSDGISIASKHRVEMGGVRVSLTDIDRPEEVTFAVDGLPVRYLQAERKGPIRSNCEFAFHLPAETQLGTRALQVRVSGVDLPSIAIEVAGLTEGGQEAQAERQQHRADAGGAGEVPLAPPIERKGNLARAVARWFQRKKA